MEGVLVTGEVDAPVTGACARCLEPLEDTLSLDVQELFAYPAAPPRRPARRTRCAGVEGDLLDLEPVVRDAVVLALPLAPLCRRTAGACASTAASGSTTCPPTTRTRCSTRAGPASRTDSHRPRARPATTDTDKEN